MKNKVIQNVINANSTINPDLNLHAFLHNLSEFYFLWFMKSEAMLSIIFQLLTLM